LEALLVHSTRRFGLPMKNASKNKHICKKFINHQIKNDKKRLLFRCRHAVVKAHTDRTRFGNATRIYSFQKQIKLPTDKNFTRYADQIAKVA
jgi:hypothetical protein